MAGSSTVSKPASIAYQGPDTAADGTGRDYRPCCNSQKGNSRAFELFVHRRMIRPVKNALNDSIPSTSPSGMETSVASTLSMGIFGFAASPR